MAGVDGDIVDDLRSSDGDLDVVVVDDPGDLMDLLALGTITTVVLGATDEEVVGDVRRLRRVDSQVPVVIAAAGDLHLRIEATLRTDPLVGRATYCLPAGRSADVAALVADSARRELRRRRHADVVRHIVDEDLPVILTEPAATSQYLGQLLEHATIGVVTVDPHGVILGWNPKAETITGRRIRDAIGASLYSLFPASAAPRLRSALEQAASASEAVTEVLTRTSPRGTDQHLELTIASIDDGVGQLGNLVLIHDATDRLRTELELADRARTAALAAAVGMALTTGDGLDGQLQRCTQAVVDHLDAAFARIWTLDPTGQVLVLRASAGLYTHLDGAHSRVRVGDLKIGRIAANRRPHLTNDVLNDPHIGDREWAARGGMVAFAGYPLILGDRLVGILALFSREPLAEITLKALASVADMIAVGIEQADNAARVIELLERERQARAEAEQALEQYVRLARTLQQSLLPPALPTVPGVELAARYHWAGQGDVVGGDFYDLFQLADGRYCLVIGDVSGKGVEAAAMTSLARHTLRTAARIHSDPIAVLAMLNEVVYGHTGGDRFCTVVVITLEPVGPGQWRSSVTNAGHVLPVHREAGGATRDVGAGGFPIGLFPELAVTECPLSVGPGDVLMLFTDGVSEARAPTGEFCPDLVYEVLRSHGDASAAELAAALEAAILRLEGGQLRDDAAIVAARFAEPPRFPNR